MRMLLAALGAALLLPALAAAPARACAVFTPLDTETVAAAPVVVRGTIDAIAVGDDLGVTFTVVVGETLRGPDAARWVVNWAAHSAVAPPHSLAEAADRYGTDIVIGFLPAEPAVTDGSGAGTIPPFACGEPFLGGFADLQPLLRQAGLVP
ncbi:MAG: hypothetical protein R3F55_02815 [Alphaproteobacteria bacterium]